MMANFPHATVTPLVQCSLMDKRVKDREKLKYLCLVAKVLKLDRLF